MTKRRLFGTDGVRDIAGEGLLSCEAVSRWGGAIAGFLSGRRQGGRPVVLGRDTRASGEWIAGSLSGALSAAGHGVLDAGVCPTGAVSFLARRHAAAIGIAVSASHNPPAYNGIKLIDADGRKLDDAGEREVERLWTGGGSPPGSVRGGSSSPLAWRKEYVSALRAFFPALDLSGREILLDCASGAAHEVALEAFAAFGAEVRRIDPAPDGRNINEGAGALHPERLVEAVRSRPGSVAFAFDGDADRCLHIDGTGTLRDGDDLLAFAAAAWRRLDPERPVAVVATVLSNHGLDRFLTGLGARVHRTDVGDRNVTERVLREKALIGAEPSGHAVIPGWGPTGDGVVTALWILAKEAEAGLKLERAIEGFQRFASIPENVKVSTKAKELESIQGVHAKKKEVEAEGMRVVLRYSGTEPVARILVEGPDLAKCRDSASALKSIIKKQIGVDTDMGP